MALSEAAAAGIIAGGSAVANITGGVIGARKNYKYTKRLYQMQNAYNKYMLDYQNAYNAPDAQMQRLRAAGINPALQATNAQLNNTSASPQSSQLSQFQGYDFSHVGSDLASQYLQQKATDAQIENTQSQTNNNNIVGGILALEKLFNQKTFDYKVRGEQGYQLSREKSIDVLEGGLTLQQLEIKNQTEQVVQQQMRSDILKANLPYLKESAMWQNRELMSRSFVNFTQGHLNIAQKDKVLADTLVDYAQINYLGAATKNQYAQASLAHAQVGVAHAQVGFLNASARNQNEQADWTYTNRIFGGADPKLTSYFRSEAQQAIDKNRFILQKDYNNTNIHEYVKDIGTLVGSFIPFHSVGGSSYNTSGWNTSYSMP